MSNALARLNSPACPREAGPCLVFFSQERDSLQAHCLAGMGRELGRQMSLAVAARALAQGDRSVCREVDKALARVRHPLLRVIPPPPPLTPQDQHQQRCQASNYIF